MNTLRSEEPEEGAGRTEQTWESNGWSVTRLPARAELTLVDPFSCTEMEGTLRGQKRRRSVGEKQRHTETESFAPLVHETEAAQR